MTKRNRRAGRTFLLFPNRKTKWNISHFHFLPFVIDEKEAVLVKSLLGLSGADVGGSLSGESAMAERRGVKSNLGEKE